jgi:selenide,water dikinase
MQASTHADLVLVGGGHAHVQVLRRWMMRPVAGVRLCVVLDRPEAVYSGMVPGFVAGDYRVEELEIDGVPLGRRAGARVILSAATRIDPQARRIELSGRAPIRYDAASLDVGSTVRGLALPGVQEHALATRPIRGFVDRLDERLRSAGGGASLSIAVVGGGAAGMELAFTLQARLRAEGRAPEIRVYTEDAEVVPGYPAHVARRVRAEAKRRGIEVFLETRVRGVEKDAVVLEGRRERCDLVVWASGAAPVALIEDSPLPHDTQGFVRVEATLAVPGCAGLFAVGDCAAIEGQPWVRKAGVFAVREGPILNRNLRAALRGAPLTRYRAQRDFLSLLHLGEGRALGAKWGLSARGRFVLRLKDRIDRRFMRRFQVLTPTGAPAQDFPRPDAPDMERMACGGCAAKVESTALERALARLGPGAPDPTVLLGLETPDDAALIQTPGGDRLLATVDAFRAFADDPYLVGRVAAVNAVSDVLAKGGRARHALALITVPDEGAERTEETLVQVLGGMRAALDPLGVSLVGGHSTLGPELFVGLSVTGELEPGTELLSLTGLVEGDVLILSKALGSGVVLAADMQGRARGRDLIATHASMLRPNLDAARIAREHGARSATDVSGFGLAGHLLSLLRASGVSATVDLDSLPALPGALALLSAGLRSTFHEQNASAHRGIALSPQARAHPALELLFDPQTSGGLLFGVALERAESALAALHRAGDNRARVVGRVEAAADAGPELRVAAGLHSP